MTFKNKYANRFKISEKKNRQIVKLFSIDLDTSQIIKISGLNWNTINRYLTGIRKRIAEFCEIEYLLKKYQASKINLYQIFTTVITGCHFYSCPAYKIGI